MGHRALSARTYGEGQEGGAERGEPGRGGPQPLDDPLWSAARLFEFYFGLWGRAAPTYPRGVNFKLLTYGGRLRERQRPLLRGGG